MKENEMKRCKQNTNLLACPYLQQLIIEEVQFLLKGFLLKLNLVFGKSSDGRVVRASALGAVDLGLILSWVKPMT